MKKEDSMKRGDTMIKIGMIGTQSMHAWAFAESCNKPDAEGKYRFPDARVTALYGVDDEEEHIQYTMEKGNVPVRVNSLEELCEHCNAFMILQRRGSEHMPYAVELIRKGYPVFIDKPVCRTAEEVEILKKLAAESGAVICGGSGMKRDIQLKELKQQMEESAFGQIRGATINHSADMDSPYDGIFFYLPHAVEMMLELFGYDPKSVSTTVHSHDNFTVCVKYEAYMINLVINGASPTYVVINGVKSAVVQVGSSDIFLETMKEFVEAIAGNQINRDVGALTKSISVILAIQESIESGREVGI